MIKNYTWDPLHPDNKLHLNLRCYGLMILNRPIKVPPEAMTKLWEGAAFRATVDGGTDQWFSYLDEHKLQLTNKYPNSVSGDFDSISHNILKECIQQGVYVEKTPDQDYTDFTKALHILKNQSPKKLDEIVAIGDTSGRIDQIFSNINTLFRLEEIFKDENVKGFILATNTILWLLQPGHHRIQIPQYLRDSLVWCSILPFAPKKSNVTTTGLKWNLCESSIEFGGLISSSNTYNGDPEVTVTTDTELVWCMGLDSELESSNNLQCSIASS